MRHELTTVKIMAKVVLVWEMGADLGHITRLDALARHLCSRGHVVTAIFSDLREIQRIYSHHNPPYQVLQGPSWTDRRLKLTRPPASLTEVLLSVGFYKSEIVAEKLLQWKTLFADLQADIILFDYAPTAQLAARQYSWHKVNLGDPFSTPPIRSPLPLFDFNAKISDANLMISDQRLVDVINQALRKVELDEIQYAHELFSADKTFLLSIPEIDPFAHWRTSEHYVGLLKTQNNGDVNLNWRDAPGKKVFGYLKPAYPHLKQFLQAVSKLDLQGRFFIPNAPQDLLDQYQQSNIEIVTTPYDISSLEQCDLVVCHGGHSTVLHSVLNGVPVLLIPLQQEQLSVTQKAVTCGLGLWLGHGVSDVEQIRATIQATVTDSSLRLATENCASRSRQCLTSPAMEVITDYVESHS
jgi:UDP:flavonoid glycosyltransferase YjiC (YdhE family)